MISIAFPTLLLLAGIFGLRRACAGRRELFAVVLLALGSRLLFSALNILEISFPYSDTTDINAFLAYAEGMGGAGFEFDVSQSYVWAALIGVINLYTGDMTFSPLVINVLAGCYTVILGYRIADVLFLDARRACRVALALAILPPLVFMSATYLRDATATLCFTAYAYQLLRFGLSRDPGISVLLGVLVWGVLAALLHGAFVILPLFALLYMVAKSLGEYLTPRAFGTYLVTLGALLVLVLGYSALGIGASKVGALYSNSGDVIQQRLLSTVASGMMAEHVDVFIHAPALFVPLAILQFLFSPFFVDQVRAFDLIRYPMALLLFVSFVQVIARAVPYPFTRLRLSLTVLAILLLAYSFLFAIGSLDPDTGFRHYVKLMPLLIAAGMPLGRPRARPEHPFDSAEFVSETAR